MTMAGLNFGITNISFKQEKFNTCDQNIEVNHGNASSNRAY